MAVVIETTLGDITIDLFVEERPTTCMNFLKLCKIKYYNFCLFHSVQQNFIAQSGDPSGSGNEGNSIFCHTQGKDSKYYEAEKLPKLKHSMVGTVSMVNCGNNMLGSQFFITLGKDLQSLDGEHCVFGEVAEGHEVLRKFNEVICDQEHRPYQDIRITHTVVLEDPFDDPSGLKVPDHSPELTKEALANSRIAPDEDIDETAGLTAEEVEELTKSREARAQATILEIVGDLPDADIAPPENVLFVCKLNPVTTDDDLEIIFSRFGKIVSCEVIRDKTTGDSLQYAFVEFENRKGCEDAYFKMDNVLIDDRRIHVDFSQSVSKLRWKGKGRGVEHLDDGKPRPDYGNYDRKTFGNVRRSPENLRQRHTDSDSHSYHRNYHNRRDSDEGRHRGQTVQESSPQNYDSRERKRRHDRSNERYQRSYDYDSNYARHRHFSEYNDSQERSKRDLQRESYSSRNKREHNERHQYTSERKEVLQNREEERRRRGGGERRSNRSGSDSEYQKEQTHKEKYERQKHRKDSIDSENGKLKHSSSRHERREHRSPSSDSGHEKVTSRKGDKFERKKTRNDSTDTDHEKSSTNKKDKVQRTKSKGENVASTDENVLSHGGEKRDKQKNRDEHSDSEGEIAHREKHERRKNSTHHSGSDEESASSRREKRKPRSSSSASLTRTRTSNCRDQKEVKRKDKFSHSDTDNEKHSSKVEKHKSTSKRNEYNSDDEKVSAGKKNKMLKTKSKSKNKNMEKDSSKSKNKKIVQRKEGKKKKRQRSKRQETSSSSETSESSSSSESESETSSSGSSSSSSSDSDNSSDSSCSGSSSSSSSYSSSSDSSRHDRKHKRRKKSAKVSVVVKKAKKTSVPTKKSKREMRRSTDSSGGESRKIKEKGQKRKVSTHSRNGEEANKRLRAKARLKKRKASSSVDSSVNSDSSDSSEQSVKQKKRHRKVAKK